MGNSLFEKLLVLGMIMPVIIVMGGCAVVGGIFKAGMGVGIFLVIAVVALIIFVVSKMGKK